MSEDYDRAVAQRWHQLLERVARAARAANVSPKKRAELSLNDLNQLAIGLGTALNGRPPPAWRERYPDDKGIRVDLVGRREDDAAAHILAARQGIIDDPAPNKTVREIFGVSAQAVQKWVKQEQANPGLATARVTSARAQQSEGLEGADILVDLRWWQFEGLKKRG